MKPSGDKRFHNSNPTTLEMATINFSLARLGTDPLGSSEVPLHTEDLDSRQPLAGCTNQRMAVRLKWPLLVHGRGWDPDYRFVFKLRTGTAPRVVLHS